MINKNMKRWKRIPDSEVDRLEKTLVNHLQKMKVRRTKKERIEFIVSKLNSQKFTCAFAAGDDTFCWNHPRNKKLSYLKLEWGHKIPRYHRKKSMFEANLILLCARCNNHIQSSRTIEQLIPELEHKLKALKNIK